MNELTFASLRFPWEVRRRQIARAFDAFLQERPPSDAMKTDPEDAFAEDPHRWLPQMSITTQTRYPREFVESIRQDKETGKRTLIRLHDEYASKGMTFDEIRIHEASSFGDPKIWQPKELAPLIERAIVVERIPGDVAARRVGAFLISDHLRQVPWVSVASRLQAAVAMMARGDLGRESEGSDLDDIQHVATYVPYVDVMVVDGFFFDLCRKLQIDLKRTFGSEVRRLGERTIDAFIRDVVKPGHESPHAELARRVHVAVREGGHWVDANRKMTAAISTMRSKRQDEAR